MRRADPQLRGEIGDLIGRSGLDRLEHPNFHRRASRCATLRNTHSFVHLIGHARQFSLATAMKIGGRPPRGFIRKSDTVSQKLSSTPRIFYHLTRSGFGLRRIGKSLQDFLFFSNNIKGECSETGKTFPTTTPSRPQSPTPKPPPSPPFTNARRFTQPH